MAVPKRKISKQRKHTRVANWKLVAPSMVECPNCHEYKLSHRVCSKCGMYDGKQIVDMGDENK